MFWMIVILSLSSTIDSVRIGKLENYIMMGIINNSLSNLTLNQCICEMINSTELISALNYFPINQTCQLFSYNTSLILIEVNLNSWFIFINQTAISIASIQSNDMSTLMTTSSTTLTTVSTTTSTTITFTPSGIYALTIPTCATWNQTGITVAGNANGTSGSDLGSLYSPVSVFVDNNNTLYVSDRDNNRVMKYYANASSGILVAGNLTAGSSSSQLNTPRGVAVDQYGAIIVGDSSNYRIQNFPIGSTVATTVAMNSSTNPLGLTRDLHIDVNNNIYVTDSDYNQVVKFYPYNGIGVVIAPTNGSGSGADQFLGPYGHFLDENQALFVADKGNHRIQMWPADAISGITVAGITGMSGSNLTLLNSPDAVIVDNNGYIYVADTGNNRIVKWTKNYTAGGVCVIGCTGAEGTAANQFNTVRDLKFDSHGNLYVSDQLNHRIQKFMIQIPTSDCPVDN